MLNLRCVSRRHNNQKVSQIREDLTPGSLHREIKALNVGIVMDDFGTGYSSLNSLWRFPFDKIKIDRSFMLALDQQGVNDDASTIVRAIIDLGRSLNVAVTVEGVENAKQVDFVSEARRDQVQGFRFGRPLPTVDVAAHIAQAAKRQFGTASTASSSGVTA